MQDKQTNPRVAISIVNWNGLEVIKSCVESILEYTEYDNFDIFVVDNGSKDGSAKMLRSNYSSVKLIENQENRGFAKANNQVFEIAAQESYDYVILVNNDVNIIKESWLSTMIQIAESDTELGVVGCKVLNPDGTVDTEGENFPIEGTNFLNGYKYNKYQLEQNLNNSDELEYVDVVTGALFLIRIEAIKALGGFDEKYSPVYGEESDFCVRCWDQGYKVAYTPLTEVSHIKYHSSDKLDPTYIHYVKLRNKLRFIFINYPVDWTLLLIPYMIKTTLLLFFERSEDNEVAVRKTTKENPKRVIKHMGMAYYEVIMDSRDIITKRRSRSHIRELTK